MDYKVVYSYSLRELEQKVIELLSSGWKLQGGVFCDSKTFLQALTRN